MRQFIKTTLLLLALLLPVTAFPYDFEVDGIYYDINGNEATVTNKELYYLSHSAIYTYTDDVTIPATVTHDGTTYSVTSIRNWAFAGCEDLTSITIPNSVVSIGEYVFGGCSGLTSITIPNSVTSIGPWAFERCSGLKRIQVENGNPSYDSRNNCNAIIESSTNTLIAGCMNTTIPNSVTSIGESAFYGCSGLNSITIPNSVTSIGTEAFSDCSGLTSITIPNSVSEISNKAFTDCSGLTSVTIPNSVTSIGIKAFNGCSGLTSVNIPNSVTSIGTEAFNGCSGLNSIKIPNSVTSIGTEAFNGCSGLTSIQVENGNPTYDSRNDCNAIIETTTNTLIAGCKNTTIPNSVTSIGESAFYCCSGLTSVNIPNSVTSIGIKAFSQCSGLTSINIPNSVTSIGESAFSHCSGLSSVNIPNSVTSIGMSAFFGCSGLTSVNIPNSVTSIGKFAFVQCSSVTTVSLTGEGEWTAGVIPNKWTAGVMPNTITTLYVDNGITGVKDMNVSPTDVYSFAVIPPICDGHSFLSYSGTLHVPSSSLAAYITAPYWCNFTNIVGDAVKPNGLSLDKDSLDLAISEKTILAASITPETASLDIITWASSNPNVATVVNGQVTAVGIGECDIIATCFDQMAVCHVIVNNDRISLD